MEHHGGRSSLRNAARTLAEQDETCRILLATHGTPRLPPKPRVDERFRSVASSITAQQVSGLAAAAIFQRVVNVVGNEFTPQRVLEVGTDELRTAGLSRAKATSMVDLATHCLDRSVDLAALGRMTDEAVIEMLTRVRGIGPWTAQMVLLFDLRRLDVWPTTDLGVRVGYANAFDLVETPTAVELMSLGERFSPYRSVVAWWCWRSTGPDDRRRAQRQALRPND